MDDTMNDTPAIDALRRALHERFGEAVPVPEGLSGLHELLGMATHATHRAWSTRPVGPDLVRLLAACALAAPTKSHLQQADVVDVRDPGLRAQVGALVPTMPWIAGAPVLLVVCGNGRRFRRLFERRGLPFANEHLDGFFNPVVDGALVLMNLVRAAESVGLGCCPVSLLRDRPRALADLLGLPAHVVPIAGLCLGWPAGHRDVNPRLPLSATFHVDRFDDRGTDAAIDAFDARHVAAQSARRPPGAGPAPAWSDERTAQYARAQRADWGRFVREQGFDLG